MVANVPTDPLRPPLSTPPSPPSPSRYVSPNTVTLTTWSTSFPCQTTTWVGVACSGGNVNSLDLPGKAIYGTVPTQLGMLTSITSAIDLGCVPRRHGTARRKCLPPPPPSLQRC